MTTLTVFTPAFNRAHTLPRTYKSLCNQSCPDFEWLIIDDGSQDDTQKLVESWITNPIVSDNGKKIVGFSKSAPWLKITYIYQENQGMHGAHNTAYENIHTELNTCIDSDDYMPEDAVEKIIFFWKSLSNKERDQYAGIIGLDIDEKDKKVIGLPFPAELRATTLSEYYRNGGRGDKKIVYRTDIITETPPYPVFEGEKYFGLNYKYILVDQKYELLVLNEPLVIVDYQEGGSSASMYKQYWNNPKGWSEYRKFEMLHTDSIKRKLKVCIHYVSNSFITGNRNFISESPERFLTLLSIIPGFLLYLQIKRNVKRNRQFKI